MISQGLKMLKRAVDERPKGGMQTGMPKIQLREADAVRAVAELEWAQAHITELEAQLEERDGYISNFPHGAVHNGKCQLERLANDYDFQCEAGSIESCIDYQGVELCFNALNEYASLAPQPPKEKDHE